LKPGLVKGPWTKEEDAQLQGWVAREGARKWSKAAMIITGRTGKQCRDRWKHHLNPTLKTSDWTIQDDETVFALYKRHGTAWSRIAADCGRSENSVKNRFYAMWKQIKSDYKEGSHTWSSFEMSGERGSESNSSWMLKQPSRSRLYVLLLQEKRQKAEGTDSERQNRRVVPLQIPERRQELRLPLRMGIKQENIHFKMEAVEHRSPWSSDGVGPQVNTPETEIGRGSDSLPSEGTIVKEERQLPAERQGQIKLWDLIDSREMFEQMFGAGGSEPNMQA
jgi:hypothetical protein